MHFISLFVNFITENFTKTMARITAEAKQASLAIKELIKPEQQEKMTEVLALTTQLMRYESTHAQPAEIERCAEMIAAYFADLPVEVRRYQQAGIPSVVVTLANNRHPRVFMVGHFDVVSGRKHDFVPRIAAGRLYGRGAADMKSEVAIMMAVMREAALCGEDFSLGLMLTGDEEKGGLNGVGYLLKQENYRCDVAFVPDGGQNFHLLDKVKGALHVKMTARGIAGHGSRPWEGENAIDRLITAYQKLRTLFPWDGSKYNSITVNLGQMHGGIATNQIPNEAEAYLDIRYPAGITYQEIFTKLQKALPDIELVEIVHTFSYSLDQTDPFIKRFSEIGAQYLGEKMKLMNSLGDCDARFFVELAIPSIITMPICDKLHGENEWVDLVSLANFYQILRQFVWEQARSDQ